MLHVLFQVGAADYVVAAGDVVQMESFTGATRVPGSPAHVAGLVQLRGRVLPVVDLRPRFGLAAQEPGVEARIVVVARQGRQVALLVERGREVIDLRPEEFQEPPELVSEQAAGFVRSIARRGDRVLMLLDLDRVIGTDAVPVEEGAHGAQT